MADEANSQIAEAVERQQGRLLNYIKARISDPDEAEDILQDVFYQLVVAYDSLRTLDKVTSWLFTVATNKITDWYRKKKPVALGSIKQSSVDGSEPLTLMDILPDVSQSPDEIFARDLIWEAVQEALDELPDEQREVFVLHEFEGKSYKEIVELTGTSLNTLLSRKHYAILHLRNRLNNIYTDI